MKRSAKIGLACIGVTFLLVLMYFRPQIVGYIKAPKFEKVHFAYTEHRKAGCFILCSYTDTYWYEAKGIQKELAQNVVDVMSKKGFHLSREEGVVCYGASGDDYYFEKGDQRIFISFFSKTSLPDVNTTSVGCDRPYAEYKVSVYPVR